MNSQWKRQKWWRENDAINAVNINHIPTAVLQTENYLDAKSLVSGITVLKTENYLDAKPLVWKITLPKTENYLDAKSLVWEISVLKTENYLDAKFIAIACTGCCRSDNYHKPDDTFSTIATFILSVYMQGWWHWGPWTMCRCIDNCAFLVQLSKNVESLNNLWTKRLSYICDLGPHLLIRINFSLLFKLTLTMVIFCLV